MGEGWGEGICSNQFRQSKIGHFHATTPIQQDILRFDVAMNDALVVGELKRIADLWNDRQRFTRRDASCIQQLAQVHAIHKFHQEVVKKLRVES
jgi:hypothetical protein